MNICNESSSFEEWWQPELKCESCNCVFMYDSYPSFPKYPTFCPNCGKKFEAIRKGNMLIYKYGKENK